MTSFLLASAPAPAPLKTVEGAANVPHTHWCMLTLDDGSRVSYDFSRSFKESPDFRELTQRGIRSKTRIRLTLNEKNQIVGFEKF